MRRRSFRCVIESNQPKKPIPPGLHGGDRRSAGARSSSQNENLKAFVADIAVKTGKGRSTVARDVTRAKKVAVLDDIAGTCLDKGDEIDAARHRRYSWQWNTAPSCAWQEPPRPCCEIESATTVKVSAR